MKKIATHNSLTGERPDGLLSRLGTPFARCQNKTIRQQYQAGCRLFDLRIKKHRGRWVGAHGLWHTRRSAASLIAEIAGFGDAYAILTYEGSKDDKHYAEFLSFIEQVKQLHVHWVYFAVKKPTWEVIEQPDTTTALRQGFLPLTDWHAILPIPYLWRNTNRLPFDDETFTLVDFL